MSAWIGAYIGHNMSCPRGEEWMFHKGGTPQDPDIPPWFLLVLLFLFVTIVSVLLYSYK